MEHIIKTTKQKFYLGDSLETLYGEIDYEIDDKNRIVVSHTYVNPMYRGQGLANLLLNRDPIKGTPENKLLSSKKGIYVFIMTTNYQRTSKFNHVYYGAPLRDLTITTFSSGVILYLGTAKSILTRMHQHFATDNDYNRTGSLKLGSINRQSLLGSFMIYAFCIKEKYAKYYPLIGPTVEKYLHNNLSVLVGNN